LAGRFDGRNRVPRFPKIFVAQKLDLATFAHSFAGGLARDVKNHEAARGKTSFVL
jgi:hypothetical protein